MDRYIQAHGRRLFGLCLTLCAHRQDAEDLYQDTWLKALAAFDQYDPARPFEPWLTRICVNTYRNTLRRLARSPNSLNAVPAPEGPDYTPLYQAIDGLPEKLRVTVILYYFEDMDVNTTAQVLDIPPGTVKSRLNKARTKLKEVLGDETEF